MTTTYILLEVTHSKDIPDLLDKAAGRAYTLDGVQDVTAREVKQDIYNKDSRYMLWGCLVEETAME